MHSSIFICIFAISKFKDMTNLEHIISFIQKSGMKLTIDTNPSPEKQERILKSIEKQKAKIKY